MDSFANKLLAKRNRPFIVLAVLILVLPLVLFLMTHSTDRQSHAANQTNLEAENAVLSGNIASSNDNNGNSYIIFGQKATTTPGSTPTISGSIQVNFSKPIQTLSPLVYGMDESGYPGGGPVLADDANEQAKFKTLGVKFVRVALKYTTAHDPTSKIVCSGSGCDLTPTGDQYVTAIKNMGATPIVIVPIDTLDAANLVKHFNKDVNIPVKYWIFGNEPTISSTDYANDFNAAYDAMKAVDSTILVGGPGSPFFDCCAPSGTWTPAMNVFMTISGSRTDFVDFHKYGQGGSTTKSDTDLMAMTSEYEANINTLRSFIQSMQPARASHIGIEIGEWQLDWDHIDPRFETEFNVVWTASAMGHILKAGAIALPYATKNLDLGYITEGSYQISGRSGGIAMPAYHGYGMFTGESLFRGFGTTMVTATTSLPNIEVYASDGSKNIIVVNKDPNTSQTATFGLTGYASGTGDIWRKDTSIDAFAQPVHVGQITVSGGNFTYSFPPYSVTTIVLN